MGYSLPCLNVSSLCAGVGVVRGRRVCVHGSDSSVKGGTMFPVSVKKQLRMQELSRRLRLPSIYLVDSGGAFLPLQVLSRTSFSGSGTLVVVPGD